MTKLDKMRIAMRKYFDGFTPEAFCRMLEEKYGLISTKDETMKITVHDTLLPATYRKKPVEIQAMVWTGDNFSAIKKWAGDNVSLDGDELVIVTLEDGSKGQAKHVATIGDYIIQGVKGEFYFCKPDIFADTYEKV